MKFFGRPKINSWLGMKVSGFAQRRAVRTLILYELARLLIDLFPFGVCHGRITRSRNLGPILQ